MTEKICLVPIPWETRNLGIESFKLSEEFIENSDSGFLRESIEKAVKKYGKVFVQARIPRKHAMLVTLLAANGFYCIEGNISPRIIFRKSQVLKRFMEDKTQFLLKRIDPEDIRVTLLDKSEKRLCDRVREIAVKSFWLDRFHMDPNCPDEVSAKRLDYLMDDLIKDEEVHIDILIYGGKTIAFMTRKAEYLQMAGFEKKYHNIGLADFFWLSVLERMGEEGFKKAETQIYHNNTGVLNLYARLGFSFKDPSSTFHYWSHPLKG